jgi:pimeloyl-ACP methyl ester carboxylesterase
MPESCSHRHHNVTALSDADLRAVQAPTLVLFGEREKICDPAAALSRAQSLIPNVEGELLPDCSHDMCFSQHQLVDARILDFLNPRRHDIAQHVVAHVDAFHQ